MIPSHEGKRVPEVTFHMREDSDWKQVTSSELFQGKKVVVFALPGAFTPTCSASHVPRYNELVPELRKHGVDSVICLSVNDAFVMDAWKADQHAHDIIFVPDGNGEFSEGMGTLVDKSVIGFGKRSWRYSMLVEDGIVTKQFIEEERPGDPFDVSDGDTMLKHLGGAIPHRVLLLTRKHCVWCHRAKALLDERGISYSEVEASPSMLEAASGRKTTPQVFMDGAHIGGFEDLKAHLDG